MRIALRCLDRCKTTLPPQPQQGGGGAAAPKTPGGGKAAKATVREGTALHFACAEGHVHVAEYLFQNGANVAALDAASCSPLDVAMLNGQHEICDWLMSKLDR